MKGKIDLHLFKQIERPKMDFSALEKTSKSRTHRLNMIEAAELVKNLREINPLISSTGIINFYKISERDEDSFFRNALCWGLSLKEPQITKAIALFLDHSDYKIKFMRVLSFLNALGCHLTPELSVEDNIDISYEHPCSDEENPKRIDILIRWTKPNNIIFSVVIEAKINSTISDNQLKAYIAWTTKEKINPRNTSYLFISRRVNSGDRAQMRASGVNWKVNIWHRFLRSWEGKIKNNIDDDDFRQFRSTLWEQLS